MNKIALRAMLFILPFFISGCAIGFDHTLFVTKSNVGIDFDSKPPTAELSIARRELVIAPTFEGGQTPPVVGGFRTSNRLLFGLDVSSVFAGGDAAFALSDKGLNPDHNARLCLSAPPVGKPHLGPIPFGTYPLPGKSEIRPFIFGADTTFGIKIAWSGMTAQFPDSLKIGFNRKELALAPVFGSERANDPLCPYAAEMPAFLASIDVAANAASLQSFGASYLQSFSTGSAAIKLAQDPYVRTLLLARLDRTPEQGSYDDADKNSACIQQWLTADETKKNEHVELIKDWWKEKGHTTQSFPLLISAKEYAEEREAFIQKNNIRCKGGQPND
ncbi:hypothetical protein [Nitrosomonas aestuarii]|uniref:hypothetical protein n=1 Tax=Nitrosomonas aestuarii TaxID=52441 RepID=UPI000D313C72|nr:hypothetical protein [Nitrosomonas aestuarii]PTN10963.1 hypothetical protein C8R11_11521 [Nitrosomonas aestuarii]